MSELPPFRPSEHLRTPFSRGPSPLAVTFPGLHPHELLKLLVVLRLHRPSVTHSSVWLSPPPPSYLPSGEPYSETSISVSTRNQTHSAFRVISRFLIVDSKRKQNFKTEKTPIWKDFTRLLPRLLSYSYFWVTIQKKINVYSLQFFVRGLNNDLFFSTKEQNCAFIDVRFIKSTVLSSWRISTGTSKEIVPTKVTSR